MNGQSDDALALMERVLASRDPLELAHAGFLSASKGRTFDKQRRVIKHNVDWWLQNDPPPTGDAPAHRTVRAVVREPVLVEDLRPPAPHRRPLLYKTCVRDDVLLRSAASSSGRARITRAAKADLPDAAGVRFRPGGVPFS